MSPKPRPRGEVVDLAKQICAFATRNEASAALGLSEPQLNRIVYQARALGFSAETAPNIRIEARDAQFWRRQARTLESELAETQQALKTVSGLMERPVRPPQWAVPSSTRKGRAAALLHISDVHTGEVVKREEVNGLNEYDLAICQRRIRRLFTATLEILPRWTQDCRLEGVVVALNGDLISGNIHDELAWTNAVESNEQVWFITDEMAAGLGKLRDKFGKVDVYVTPGNHGRQTRRTHAKRTAALNFDTMIGKALSRHFAGDKRVTIHVSPSREAKYSIFGWSVLQTHHDAGGGGGQGFAGPVLPIVRKGKKLEHIGIQRREFYEIILTAHHHFVTNPTYRLFGNGSVIGANEYSLNELLAEPEPPMQWLLLVTEKWGVRERLPVRLEER